ncbi:MAG TPA: sigma-70 family RNA polymerase sigma factor [Vicinamibacterales bacterium]|nr:sigma-70 family RNA polymerase sigma factor [Vicinamibacterales bacterium]
MEEPKPPGGTSPLISTTDLLARARSGDTAARNELFARYLPALRRWARGQLPAWTRDLRDTDDIVQDTLVQTLRRLDEFEPRHEGALQAYLRQAVVNRVRDEVRRAARRPMPAELPEEYEDPSVSPLDQAIGRQASARYESALQRLRPEDRELVVARVEMGNSYRQIADSHGKPSADAARMAVARALLRLAEEMDRER